MAKKPDTTTPDSGWPALRAALESGNQADAERIAYSLAIPAGVVEAMSLAVTEAATWSATVEATARAAVDLDRTRNHLAMVRTIAPQNVEQAAELADRVAELVNTEAKLMNDAGTHTVAEAALCGCWAAFPDLFSVAPGLYRARPVGRLGEWLAARNVDIRQREWWQYLNDAEPRRTVRIVAAPQSLSTRG